MTEYNPTKPDNYAVHLANLSSAGGAVATRDIFNEQGTLLIKKGNVIRDSSVRLLLNHKLIAPLETSVSISSALTAQQLYEQVNQGLNRDKENWAIHTHLQLDDLLKRNCLRAMRFPLVSQKITVLADRLKLEYEKALFCAWFSMALATQISASAELIEDAFLAGLVHDTGLLHIDSSIAEKTGEYTAEEWRAVQSHTLIADVFLSYIDKLTPNVRRAVREHHERCDGSGYPSALVESKLCLTGQIIGMADTVWAISKKPVGRKGISIGDVLTIIRMNKQQHPTLVESALYRLHQKIVAIGVHPPVPSLPSNIKDYLADMGKRMLAAYASISVLHGVLQPSESDRVAQSAYMKLSRLHQVFNGSGLLTQSILGWLTSNDPEEKTSMFYDLHELSLMYNEFEWQLFQFARSIRQLLHHAKNCSPDIKESVMSVLKVLEPLIQQKTVENPTAASEEV